MLRDDGLEGTLDALAYATLVALVCAALAGLLHAMRNNSPQNARAPRALPHAPRACHGLHARAPFRERLRRRLRKAIILALLLVARIAVRALALYRSALRHAAR